jgi:hypothetical protein
MHVKVSTLRTGLARALLALVLAGQLGGCRWVAGYDAAEDARVDRDGGSPDGDAGSESDSGDAAPPTPPPPLKWQTVFGSRSSAIEVGGVAVDGDRRYIVGRYDGRLEIPGATPPAVIAPRGRRALFVYRYKPGDSGADRLWSLAAKDGEITSVRDALIVGGKLIVLVTAHGVLPHQLAVSTGPAPTFVLWLDLEQLDAGSGGDAYGLVTASGRIALMEQPWALAANSTLVYVAGEHQTGGTAGEIVAFKVGADKRALPEGTINVSASSSLRLRAVAATESCLFHASSGKNKVTVTLPLGQTQDITLLSERTVLAYHQLDVAGLPTSTALQNVKPPTQTGWARPLALSASQPSKCRAQLLRTTNKGLVLERFDGNATGLIIVTGKSAGLEAHGGKSFNRLSIVRSRSTDRVADC